jgi:hypothetical protein
VLFVRIADFDVGEPSEWSPAKLAFIGAVAKDALCLARHFVKIQISLTPLV